MFHIHHVAIKEMISRVLSDFPSEFHFRLIYYYFRPLFSTKQNKGNLKSKSTCTCTL